MCVLKQLIYGDFKYHSTLKAMRNPKKKENITAMKKKTIRQNQIHHKSLVEGTARMGDQKFLKKRTDSVDTIMREYRNKTAHTTAIEVRDKQYRIQQKKKKAQQNGIGGYVDFIICDVEHYHNSRYDRLVHEKLENKPGPKKQAQQMHIEKVALRWMSFMCEYYHNNKTGEPDRWHIKQENINPMPAKMTPSWSIKRYMVPNNCDLHIHRKLISLCRNQVWHDKMTEKDVKIASHGTKKSMGCTCGCEPKRLRFNYVCPECGAVAATTDIKDMNFKELEANQQPSPSYKRRNHLHEWLTRAQASERKIVPLEVKTIILKCFQRWGIGRNDATYALVRRFLRESGYQRYFEHIPQIISWLTGKDAFKLTETQINQIKHVFHIIQVPFEVHKPKERKNFLSYSYVLYKVCELMDLDDVLVSFPLLKSRSNLMKADSLWRKICVDCKLQYIPTT